VNLGDMLQWPNKHLLPLLIKDRWKGPKEMPHLRALVKQVLELRRLGLKACHCAEGFILWRICLLDH
jgi:hypothetical protein